MKSGETSEDRKPSGARLMQMLNSVAFPLRLSYVSSLLMHYTEEEYVKKKAPTKKATGKKKETALVVAPAVKTVGQLTQYSPEVQKLLHKQTPPEFIDKHPFNGLSYVQIGYVRRCLDDYCAKLGATWSDSVEDVGAIETLLKAKQIVVRVTLTIQFSDGRVVQREQFGGSEVKCYKDNHRTKPGMPMDLGNDYKAAASDGLKKCASLLGIAQDVFEPKIEAKIKESGKQIENGDDVVNVIGGKVVSVEEEATVPPLAKFKTAFKDDERIDMKAVATIAKLFAENGLDTAGREFMKEHFGTTLTSSLKGAQYKLLMNWILEQDPENPPF